MSRRGLMLIMSSPSGAGKTTLTRRLLAENHGISMSVSATTRAPRDGEKDGEDYYFVSHDEFNQMIENNQMLEHATVFGNLYGTPRGPVEKALEEGRDVLFDIDWQGAQQLVNNAKDDLVTIFILPPSIEELAKRLKTRALDSKETIAKRMAEAKNEISHWDAYDYVFVNDDLDKTYDELRGVIKSEGLKRQRQPEIGSLAKKLMDDAS